MRYVRRARLCATLAVALLSSCDEPQRRLAQPDVPAGSSSFDVIDPNDVTDARDVTDPNDVTDPRDVTDARDVTDPRDADRAMDAGDARDASDVGDASNATDATVASEVLEVRDAVVARDAARGARATPSLDGVLGADWPTTSLVATNTTPSPWGESRNALRSLRVAWDDAHLFLGVEGTVEPINAIAVFIDRDFGVGAASGVTALTTLTDGVGALDDSLSCAIDQLPVGFGAELAWGTRGMLRKGSTELRDDVGLRELACPRCAADLSWVAGDTVVCVEGSRPACEVAIAWTAIYGPSGRPPQPRLALFVRLLSARGDSVAPEVSLPPDSSPVAARVTSVFDLHASP